MRKGRIEGLEFDRLGKIGNIRVGIKNENGIPRSLDHFVAQSANAEHETRFRQVYGEKPTALQILFPSDDVENVCNLRYECRGRKDSQYGAGKKVAFGDGTEFMVWNGDRYVIQKDLGTEQYRALGTWKMILTLRFILVKFGKVYGFWQFSTSGKESSIPAIVGPFDRVMRMLKDRTDLITRIPFELTVEPAVSQKPGEQSRFPVVQLIPNLSQGLLEEVHQLFHGEGESIVGMLTEEKATRLLELSHDGEDDASEG